MHHGDGSTYLLEYDHDSVYLVCVTSTYFTENCCDVLRASDWEAKGEAKEIQGKAKETEILRLLNFPPPPENASQLHLTV